MRRLVLVYILLSFNSIAFGASGQCIALGRVAGEDRVCAKYDDTDEQTCGKADGWARCAWKPVPKSTRGHGPLHVECKTADGIIKIYNVNSVFYTGDDKSLVAVGFGPNRQDDGMAQLNGDCSITVKKEE